MTPAEVLKAIQEELTVPVPTAARAFGTARNATYDAVKRGEIPSIRVGRSLRVPTSALRQMLGIEPKEVA